MVQLKQVSESCAGGKLSKIVLLMPLTFFFAKSPDAPRTAAVMSKRCGKTPFHQSQYLRRAGVRTKTCHPPPLSLSYSPTMIVSSSKAGTAACCCCCGMVCMRAK